MENKVHTIILTLPPKDALTALNAKSYGPSFRTTPLEEVTRLLY